MSCVLLNKIVVQRITTTAVLQRAGDGRTLRRYDVDIPTKS